MENKINVAELLKDCPKGMKLDCPLFDDVEFDHIDKCSKMYPIYCRVKIGKNKFATETFTSYGTYTTDKYAKCAIFPKGKTTWEGFEPPVAFKDGDIITCTNRVGSFVAIYKEKASDALFKSYVVTSLCKHPLFKINSNASDYSYPRFATEEEKAKLFQAIEDNGYKWDAEMKCLEKSVEPKFKDGDRITNGKASIRIGYIDDDYYYEIGRSIASRILIKEQEEWRLDKFDITTLKPFESKVLVRHNKDNKWGGSFFSYIDKDFHSHCYKFVTTAGKSYPYCIPFENNEHLLGTADDCDEFYKTWEK